MKKLILTATCFLTLFSCIEVKFEESQPINTKSLTEFPKSLQGRYIVNSGDSISDTIVIAKNCYTEIAAIKVDSTNKTEDKKFYLSDSLVLKEFNTQYIVNIKEKGSWFMAIIKQLNNNGLSILTIDASNEEAIERVKEITNVKTIRDEKGEIDTYILNPTKAEFEKLLQMESVFIELNSLKKLQE